MRLIFGLSAPVWLGLILVFTVNSWTVAQNRAHAARHKANEDARSSLSSFLAEQNTDDLKVEDYELRDAGSGSSYRATVKYRVRVNGNLRAATAEFEYQNGRWNLADATSRKP